MTIAPIRGRGILEIPGIAVGHAGHFAADGLTGVTAVLPPPGARVGVDVRGGGPATHETDVIAPGTHSYGADAIVITGGSALGLQSVSGVVRTLAEAGRGFPAPGLTDTVVPLVPAAAIFDLGRGDGPVRPPTDSDGATAARAALRSTHDGTESTAVRGSLGAGLGARSGMQSMRSSLGSVSIRLPGGYLVAALVVANPFGTIGTPDGTLWTHPLLNSYGFDLPSIGHLPTPPTSTMEATSAKNTTIAIVATNAALDPAQVTRMAAGAQAGIARAIRPSHTLFDGDTVFGIATGEVALPDDFAASTLDQVTITAAAADALSLAVIDAHVAAASVEDSWGQPPTLSDVAPEFAGAFAALP